MKRTPATPLWTRLRLTAAEAGASVLETGAAAAGAALLALYGASLVDAVASAARLAAAAAFAGALTLLARLLSPAADAAMTRGLLRPAERRAACALLAATATASVAAIDPGLTLFGLATTAAIAWAAASARRADPGLWAAAAAPAAVFIAAWAAQMVGWIAGASEPSVLPLALATLGAVAVAAPLGLSLDLGRLPPRAPALAAALALAAPIICVAALERQAPAAAPLAVAGAAFVGSVQAAALALGRVAPRAAARGARLFAAAAILALAAAAFAA